MNKDNKAIFENFARSRQQIVSEMTPAQLRAKTAALQQAGQESGASGPNGWYQDAIDGGSSYDQFQQMVTDGSLGEHLSTFGSAEEAAEYLNGIKKEYDERAEAEGLPPSDSPDSPFAQGEDMARANFPEYDNAKESLAARGEADPAAAGPELDFKDEEAPAVSQDGQPVEDESKEPNWAELGATRIPDIPPGADTPRGGAPSEPPPATDMTGVGIPGVNNDQGASQLSSEPNDPVVAQSGVEDIEPGTVPPVATDQPIEPGEANTAPLNTGGSSSITSLPTGSDDLELGVDTPLPEDPTISATFDAGGDPTDSISRDYVNNDEYAGENETPRVIGDDPYGVQAAGKPKDFAAGGKFAPPNEELSDVPGQNASSARDIPQAADAQKPGSLLGGWKNFVKNKAAPVRRIAKDGADAVGNAVNTAANMGVDMVDITNTANEFDPATGERRPVPEPGSDIQVDIPSPEEDYDNIANAVDVSVPGAEQWADTPAGRKGQRRELRQADRARDRKFKQDQQAIARDAIGARQQKDLADQRKEYEGKSLDDLYALRDKMRLKHQERRFARQDTRQKLRDNKAARKAARNNPGGEEIGVTGPAGPAGEQDTPITGGQREDGYSSADITDADLEGQYVDAELDGDQGALADGSISDEEAARINAGLDDAAAATQTTPSRPLSTPEPEATAQKPGLGRKLMSFLPGGEKPSEVWGKHAGREGINAKVRGANNTTSFKDYNAARNAEQQASAQRKADSRVAAKKSAGTLNKPKPAPGGLSRTTDKKPPQAGQTSSATPADSQKKKGGFFSGFKAKDPGKPAGRIKSVRDR